MPDPDSPETPVRSGRRRSAKFLLLALIAATSALALVAATQNWVEIALREGAAATSSLTITGQDLNPSLSPISFAGFAAVLALTIAGPVFRRILAVIVALLGVGIVALASFAVGDPGGASEGSIASVTGILGEAQGDLVEGVELTVWPWLAIAAGAILFMAGVSVLIVARRWRGGGRRYETSQVPSDQSASLTEPIETRGPAASEKESAEPDRISDWDAITEGKDPTGRS